MSKIGVMVCGHGSRHSAAVSEFENVAVGLRAHFPDYPVEYGFLEFAKPIIRTGLDKLIDQGVTQILAVPGMLLAAGHVKNDIVSVLNEYQAKNNTTGGNVEIGFGRALDLDPKMLSAARTRIEEAEATVSDDVPREDTLLMVVGRGTSDPDANGEIAKIARMLGEGMGYGWTEICYSGVTFPLVAPGLEHAVKLGYRRIIVFPYFLFTGVLVERIYSITDEIAARNTDIEFVKAGYLNDQPNVIKTFAERVQGILEGDNNMNCMTCKYREQIVGFEADLGAPQMSHHHHVEGIGTDADEPTETKNSDAGQTHAHSHSDDREHDHGHDDDHGHHHAPHPHADHPHGPGRRDPSAA